MKKDEILAKAQMENRGKDFAAQAAQKDGSMIGYIVGIIAIILVDTINGIVFHTVNRGADFALFTMAFVLFLVKYIKLRKAHSLVATIIWGMLSIGMLFVWILQLCQVI